MFSINTGKNVTSMQPSRYEVENRFKKILELSSKLATLCVQAKSLQQLYSSPVLTLRQRLCDEIKVIFRYAPIEYGQRCEEILWKRNYYDYVKFCKKYRKEINSNELSIFRMHITSGIGHYQSLFFSFCKTFNLTNLEDFLLYLPFKPISTVKASDIINYNLTGSNDVKCTALKSIFEDEPTLDENHYIGDIDNDNEDGMSIELDLEYVQDEKYLPSLNYLAHRFCICLGDLARYYVDFFPNPENSKSIAENRFSHYYFNIASFYYKSASIIEPSLGMPFNQLGTLYTGGYYGLDSLYYYVRCLSAKETFAGVKENMRTIFETSKKMILLSSSNANGQLKGKMFNNLKSKQIGRNVQSTKQLVKEAILHVIKLFSEIFNANCEVDNIGNRPLSVGKLLNFTNETLLKLSLAFNAEPSPTSSRTSLGSLTPESIFQVISIFAMLTEQIKGPNESPIVAKLENVKYLKPEDVITDSQLKVNYLLFTTYRFLFKFLALLIKKENELLRKWLVTIPTPTASNSNKSKDHSATDQLKNRQPKLKKPLPPQLGTSFSSEFNDNGEDSAMLNQLKSTALQSIVALFDQSDNEDDEGKVVNGHQNGDDSDNESVSDLIEKLIFSDEENDLDDSSLIDQALNRSAAPRPIGTKAFNNGKPSTNNGASVINPIGAKTMDQLLDEVYKNRHNAVIKFFCDFLQANADFINLLEHPDILQFFLEFCSSFCQQQHLISF